MDTINISKTSFGSLGDTGDFVGRYVVDVKEALIAAALSSNHVMLIGEPGTGKTSISRAVFEKMFNGLSKFQRFSPTTEPEVITGVPHPRKIYEDGVYEYNTLDTVSDPKYKGIVLDEIQRMNDAGLELMMQRLDRNGMPDDYGPVCVACVNWIPKGERMSAVIDRFGEMLYINGGGLSYELIAMKMMEANIDGRGRHKNPGLGIPDLDTIEAVRQAKPAKESLKLVAKFLDDFAKQAAVGLRDSKGDIVAKFQVNNRRLEQWTSLVMRTAIYETGKADFDRIPQAAKSVLRFAWVSQDKDQLAHWQSFIQSGTADPSEAIVNVLMEQGLVKMNEIYQSNINNQLQRTREFGVFIQNKGDELIKALTEAGVENPKESEAFQRAFERLGIAFANVAQGKPPLDSNDDDEEDD